MKIFRIILVLLISFASFITFAQEVKAATVYLTVSGTTSDVWAADSNAVYATAQASATSAAGGAPAGLFNYVGQELAGGIYGVFRSYLYFDTSAIPDAAIVTAATMVLAGQSDSSAVDFNIQIQSGMPTDPADPYTTADFDQSLYAGNGGSLTTAGWNTPLDPDPFNDIALSATGIGWINLTGQTKFCLRSSLDIAATAPAGDEFVTFYSTDWSSIYAPKLEITYFTTNDVLSTLPATKIKPTEAYLNGHLYVMAGVFTTCYFKYGLTTAYGTDSDTITLDAVGAFEVLVTGLNYSTEYHFKAVAFFGDLKFEGEDMSFTTSPVTGTSTDLQIKDVAVFHSYKEANDMLVCVETICTYPGYYPTKLPGAYFQIQLIDLDTTTVLAASPLSGWGNKPNSIYLSAARRAAIPIVELSAYIIKLIGYNVPGNPSVSHTLTVNEWKGTNYDKLDEYARGVAKNMAISDGVAINYYLTTPPGGIEVINDVAGGWFITGIPYIEIKRPNLFASTISQTNIVVGVANNTWDSAVAWAGYVGANITADTGIFGAPFAQTGKAFLEFMTALFVIGIMIAVVSATGGQGALGAILICAPVIWLSIYFRITPIMVGGVIVLIAVLLFLWQFIFKPL